jgi:PhzF family phenazine biosynthesis protein
MKHNITFVDAFTNEVLKGNSAAVLLLGEWLPDCTMQAIATENNLSETAFVVRAPDGKFHIRWFSPMKEIAFCGHATLASAFVIFKQMDHAARSSGTTITFWAQAVGDLEVKRERSGRMEMSVPNREPASVNQPPQALTEAMPVGYLAILQNQQAYVVVYPHESDVRTCMPDLERLKQLAPLDVCVTSVASDNNAAYDFVSRYFWPANGGVEDPVTGSIHAALAPYWAKKIGKMNLVGLQASKRSGLVYCRLEGDRVLISGDAVQYLEGVIDI